MTGMSLQERIDQAVRATFAAEQETDPRAGMVVEWALTCEIAGVDGDIYLHTLRSPGSMPWRALGMIEAHAGDLRFMMATPEDDQ
jgi:hypothetical protein